MVKGDFFQKKQEIYSELARNNKLIYWYNIPDILEIARNLYIDNIPLSIYLLNPTSVRQNCYVCGFLLAQLFRDYPLTLYLAEINSLRYSLQNKIGFEDDIHVFLVIELDVGSYVLDSANIGFLIDKDIYFEIENPDNKLKLTKDKVFSKYTRGFSKDLKNMSILDTYLEELISRVSEDDFIYKEAIFQRARLKK